MPQLLGNSDSLQLFPLAYPCAWDLYLENMGNHWTPQEIPAADDAAASAGIHAVTKRRAAPGVSTRVRSAKPALRGMDSGFPAGMTVLMQARDGALRPAEASC